MLLAERAGRKLEPWSNSRPRGMAVITRGLTRVVVTESGLSAYFISSFMLRHGDHANRSASRFYLFNVVLIAAWMRAGHRIFIFFSRVKFISANSNPIFRCARISLCNFAKQIFTPLFEGIIMRKLTYALVLSTSLLAAGAAFAQNAVMVGGQSMLPSKDIVDNAVNSADHTTLVAAVKAAGLVETLKGKGPFTVFAPTNAAFGKLPAGTVDTLVKPENKATLTKILTYHVVPGKYDFMALSNEIKKHDGKATLPTASGGKLMFVMNGMHNINVMDESGNTASISTYDVYQSNGVINVIDTVLLPK